jgi:acyl-ACP thioesterase
MNGAMSDRLEARHEKEFSVRTYETDLRGRLRLSALLNYFQEAAGEHAERLGAGVIELLKRDLTWVISRYHIRILRYPRWKEKVLLSTWPSGNQGLFALREFEVRDGERRPLAAATSSWMLIDLKAKKPVEPAENLGPYPQDPGRAVASSFDPLPALRTVDKEAFFRVRLSDLDWNKHVNHVVYVEWALESAPAAVLERQEPAEIEIDFRGEAFFGDSVIARSELVSQGDGPRTCHGISKENPSKELVRLRIHWVESSR